MCKNINQKQITEPIIITAGATYLDIDAYACCVAMEELLILKGRDAVAYSCAPYNYSVCKTLINEGQITNVLPFDCRKEDLKYILVDISDPDFLKDSVPLNNVVQVYDHHIGAEEYWNSRIGDNSHIEFIGAAATLIYREWKKEGLQDKMTRSTALLLIAAILDNTLNLTSSNTTKEDIDVFNELCSREKIDADWCEAYFSQVQESIEADLENALFSDIKTIKNNDILPSRVSQLCVWDSEKIFRKIEEIRQYFKKINDSWMINIIDIKCHCSYFVCGDKEHQNKIAKVFDITFDSDVAKTSLPYLRKEIIKKTYLINKSGGK